MAQSSLPPTGFRPLRPGDIPTELEVIINSPEGMPFIGPRESIGMPPAKATVGMGALYPEEPTILHKAGKMAAQSALPIAGGFAGAKLGTALGGPVGTVVGGSTGSMAGEGINQMLGITEPSTMSVVAQGVPLPGARAVRGALNRVIPGVEAGMQELVTTAAQKLPARLAPAAEYGQLYEAAKAAGAKVPKGPMAQAAASVRMQEGAVPPAGRLPRVERALRLVEQALGVDQMLKTRPGAQAPWSSDVDMETLLPTLQRLGDVYRSSVRKGGPSTARLAELYGGMQDALEESVQRGTGPGVQFLREANAAFKRHLAESEMEGLVHKATRSVTGLPSFNADSVLNRLFEWTDEYKRLARWTSKTEIEEIKDTLRFLAKYAPIGSGGQMGVQGMPFAQRAIVGGALGAATGGPAGAATGVIATEALTQLIMTKPGRSLVKMIAPTKLGGKGATFDQVLNAASQLGIAGMKEPGPVMLGQAGVSDESARIGGVQPR